MIYALRMSTATTLPQLTEAQQRVLATMSNHARCVGAKTTDPRSGYVNTTAAKALVELGLVRETEGQHGVTVFVLTNEGADYYWQHA